MSIGAKAGVIFRRIGGRVIPIVKNVGIGAASGYVSGRMVTDVAAAEEGGNKGAKIGAAIGIVASIPPRPVARAVKHFATRYWMGVKASANAKKAAKTGFNATRNYSKAIIKK
jgi:hypothetical protein